MSTEESNSCQLFSFLTLFFSFQITVDLTELKILLVCLRPEEMKESSLYFLMDLTLKV